MTRTVIAAEPFVRWGWIGDHTAEIVARLLQHVELTGAALLIGLAISFPVGLIAHKRRRLLPPILWTAGLIYTIPSLALFAFLVPYTGLTTTSALIGLSSYTLISLVRNITLGLSQVSEDVIESARGMGYSGFQLLYRVELPLAVPVIIGGIRIATVTTIGLVTVTSLIGEGGLGYFILIGLRRFFPTAIMVGAVASVALAIVADSLLLGVQRLLAPWAVAGTGGSRRSKGSRAEVRVA